MSQNESQEQNCEAHEWYMVLTKLVTNNPLVDPKVPFMERACRLCGRHEWTTRPDNDDNEWLEDITSESTMGWHGWMRRHYGSRS